ncbi:MAG TPA: hypothetical protein PK990_03435 [Salinivirgaceae bacterium]|nr:hypothetical protein [Salinivirgaceae bacterium]
MKLRTTLSSVFFSLIALLSSAGIHFYFHHCNTCQVTEISIDPDNVSCEKHHHRNQPTEHTSCLFSQQPHHPYFNNHCCKHGAIAYLIPYQTPTTQSIQLLPVYQDLPKNSILVFNQFPIFSKSGSSDFKQNSSPPFPFVGIDFHIALHSLKISPATL